MLTILSPPIRQREILRTMGPLIRVRLSSIPLLDFAKVELKVRGVDFIDAEPTGSSEEEESDFNPKRLFQRSTAVG